MRASPTSIHWAAGFIFTTKADERSWAESKSRVLPKQPFQEFNHALLIVPAVKAKVLPDELKSQCQASRRDVTTSFLSLSSWRNAPTFPSHDVIDWSRRLFIHKRQNLENIWLVSTRGSARDKAGHIGSRCFRMLQISQKRGWSCLQVYEKRELSESQQQVKRKQVQNVLFTFRCNYGSLRTKAEQCIQHDR